MSLAALMMILHQVGHRVNIISRNNSLVVGVVLILEEDLEVEAPEVEEAHRMEAEHKALAEVLEVELAEIQEVPEKKVQVPERKIPVAVAVLVPVEEVRKVIQKGDTGKHWRQ
jgi:hypothetical protein